MAIFEVNEMQEFFIREIGNFTKEAVTHPVRTGLAITRESIGFAIRNPITTIFLGPYIATFSTVIFANLVARVVKGEDLIDL